MPPKKKVEGDPGKGEKLFKNLCAVCHNFASHGTGPNQNGVVGSNTGTKDGFGYS
jgi:cytochrome c2